MNNNGTYFSANEIVHYWVCEWRNLPHEEWWPEFKNGLEEDELYMSGSPTQDSCVEKVGIRNLWTVGASIVALKRRGGVNE